MKLITELKLKYYTQKLNSEMRKKINSSLPIGSIIPRCLYSIRVH